MKGIAHGLLWFRIWRRVCSSSWIWGHIVNIDGSHDFFDLSGFTGALFDPSNITNHEQYAP